MRPLTLTWLTKLRSMAPAVGSIIGLISIIFGLYEFRRRSDAEARLTQAKQQIESLDKQLRDSRDQVEKLIPRLGLPSVPIMTGLEISIGEYQTGKIGDELQITVLSIIALSGPAQYSVNAAVDYRGLPRMQIRNALPGYTVEYPQHHGYSIGVHKITSNSVTFLIFKTPDESSR